MMEFHISRNVREQYQVRDALFNYVGNVVFGNLAASRELANRMNEARGAATRPEATVNPGALFAMGLIDEISHAMVAFYRKNYDPEVTKRALEWFADKIGPEGVEKLLNQFASEFPNVPVFRGEARLEDWLAGSTEGMPHREAVLEEVMLLWLANQNRAFSPFKELFDDKDLKETTPYPQVTAELSPFFKSRPGIPVDSDDPASERMSLLDVLRAPMLASPDSLSGQLEYMRNNWAEVLGADLRRFLLASDVLKEEDLAIWMRFHPPTPGQRRHQWQTGQQGGFSEVPVFGARDVEYERFSPDVDWMPNVVLIAKSTYVWLAQLTKQYGRPIHTLDQIPDEELDLLKDRGLNALWLIGIWERSRASKTIKRLCGQQDAVASAYSLASYRIADDLGGEEAYRNLRDRAASRGIRLASDMVPNHMGIDSSWVAEHPEWFLSRPDSPYPAYKFDGPDLSNDHRVEIKIEDHYYNQTDAAVVFRRRDTQSGHVEYVYHGNDGTSFPWNDTAQLNYLNAAVREQVIRTILEVAKLFPIIRFDAAMTLARRHVQRLWFPLPGSGGAIPSRAEYSMTQAEFDAAMPHEFWREVVDRVAVEVPGTLLLAEAFWLLEGYFVRTLGMHRVYNSAFMNMLRDEDNAKYRSVLKNTLEFDPDIMKRYVNFMSNPDERTAIDQFGTGDKYFGTSALLATLPGLPMFGHGQVEGFTEKYGMEYQKPRYDEKPDPGLVARHQREIAPLLKQRWLFAESENFLLYDFWRPDGKVDENVFAYSNRRGDKRAVVLFHNHYGDTHGTIHKSAAYADKSTGTLRQRALHEGLELPSDPAVFLAVRDGASNLEFLHRATALTERGLPVHLHAYQYRVLLDWRELRASKEHPWDQLHDSLNGAGVPDLNEALVRLRLRPVTDAVYAALDPGLVRTLVELSELMDVITDRDAHVLKASAANRQRHDFFSEITDRACRFFEEARQAYKQRHPLEQPDLQAEPMDAADVAASFQRNLRRAMALPHVEDAFESGWSSEGRRVLPSRSPRIDATAVWAPVLGWCLTRTLADALSAEGFEVEATHVFDELRLRPALAEAFATLGIDHGDNWRAAARIRIDLLNGREPEKKPEAVWQTRAWWDDPDVAWLTGLHEADGIEYFNKEAFEQLLWWAKLPELLHLTGSSAGAIKAAAAITAEVDEGLEAAKKAQYRLGVLLKRDSSPELSDAGALLSPQGSSIADAESPTAEESEAAVGAPSGKKTSS